MPIGRVDILDQHVSATMEGLGVELDLNQVLEALAQIELASIPDPLWDNVGASQISTLRIMSTGD